MKLSAIINMDKVRPIVDAVLYEGYLLYPYRATSTKNRQRWTFGGIYPRVYANATGGAEPCYMQTQCLVEGGPGTRIEVRVRFLHPLPLSMSRAAYHEGVTTWNGTIRGAAVAAGCNSGGRSATAFASPK